MEYYASSDQDPYLAGSRYRQRGTGDQPGSGNIRSLDFRSNRSPGIQAAAAQPQKASEEAFRETDVWNRIRTGYGIP